VCVALMLPSSCIFTPPVLKQNKTVTMYKSTAALCFVLFAGQAMALETELSDDQGSGKLYFTGPGYTINLIPQAILLGLLSFLAVYFLGLDLFGGAATAPATGYGAPAVGYGAPEPSYSAPAASYDAPAPAYSAAGRYYDTYDNTQAGAYEEAARKKRSSF